MSIDDLKSKVVSILQDKRTLLDEKLTDKYFFLSLGEYVKFIQQLDFFPEIEKQIQESKKNDEKDVNELGQKILKDTEKVKTELVSKLKAKKLPLVKLNDDFFNQIYGRQIQNYNASNHYERYRDGNFWMSGDKVENLYSMVGHMLNGLHSHGLRDIVEPYVEFTKGNDSNEFVTKWLISDKIERYRRAVEILKTKALSAPWSVYEHLFLVPFTLYDWPEYRDELVKKFEKKEVPFMEVANLDGLVLEMKEVVEEKKDRKIEFVKDVYLFYAKTFTFYLIDFVILSRSKKGNNHITEPFITDHIRERGNPKSSDVSDSMTKVDKITTIIKETVKWPQDFKWDKDERDFLLGTEAKLVFDQGQSHIKDVFKKLLDKQGDWAETIRFIGEPLNLSDTDVKKHIGHLKKKIIDQTVESYIVIEPREDPSQKSAYRLVPHPTEKLRKFLKHKSV